jgi:hypothetical protein
MPPLRGSRGSYAISIPRLARRGLQDVATAVASGKAVSLRLTPMPLVATLGSAVPTGRAARALPLRRKWGLCHCGRCICATPASVTYGAFRGPREHLALQIRLTVAWGSGQEYLWGPQKLESENSADRDLP